MNKLLTNTLLGGALLSISSLTFAAPDFDRIHQDVSVMSNIIKGAFEADKECRGCDSRIESSYLANQGAVFTIRTNSWRIFQTHDGHHEDYSFVIPAPPGPGDSPSVEITEVVSDVLDNLGTVMEDVGSRIELKLAEIDYDSGSRIDSETRRALRELNRQRREFEYQQREYEIELIHADEVERKNIEKRVEELDKKVAKLEKKQSNLSEKFELERAEREKQRQAKRELEKQQTALQLKKVEDVVLNSLCDYGATLKNIPKQEHVSVVFERRGEEKARVFVMTMEDVQGCRDINVLRADSTSYSF